MHAHPPTKNPKKNPKQKGHAKVVRLLLDAKADANTLDSRQRTPEQRCMSAGNIYIYIYIYIFIYIYIYIYMYKSATLREHGSAPVEEEAHCTRETLFLSLNESRVYHTCVYRFS